MKSLADELEELAEKFGSLKDDDEAAREHVKIFIEKATQLRDSVQKKMKFYSPTRKRIARLQLIDLDNQIAQLRHDFRLFEDKCEEEKEKDAEVSRLCEQGLDTMQQIYIELKNNLNAEKFEEFVQTVIEPMPPELKQEFMEGVAKREAEMKKSE